MSAGVSAAAQAGSYKIPVDVSRRSVAEFVSEIFGETQPTQTGKTTVFTVRGLVFTVHFNVKLPTLQKVNISEHYLLVYKHTMNLLFKHTMKGSCFELQP